MKKRNKKKIKIRYPKIEKVKPEGPCGECERYIYGTPCFKSAHFCCRQGYINPATVKDCKDFLKKKYPVYFSNTPAFKHAEAEYAGYQMGFNFRDDYFYGGY
jgi:hypothetical protein